MSRDELPFPKAAQPLLEPTPETQQPTPQPKAPEPERRTLNLTRHQQKIYADWKATHGEDSPPPFHLTGPSTAVWLNRKTRRLLAKQSRKAGQ